MMAVSGVRISWLVLARNSLFARLAASAAERASTSSSAARFFSVMSRRKPLNSTPSAVCTGAIESSTVMRVPSRRSAGTSRRLPSTRLAPVSR